MIKILSGIDAKLKHMLCSDASKILEEKGQENDLSDS